MNHQALTSSSSFLSQCPGSDKQTAIETCMGEDGLQTCEECYQYQEFMNAFVDSYKADKVDPLALVAQLDMTQRKCSFCDLHIIYKHHFKKFHDKSKK